jgi:TonB family protein
VGAAGLLLLTPRLRLRTGPALRTAPLPVTATVVSAIAHGTLVAMLVVAATLWSQNQPKTYVVNLVPAVAAVGTPQGRAADPPRPAEPPPRVPERPAELPQRPTPRPPAPPPELPARAPELPVRTPELPARAPELPARTPAALPERPSLPRPSATPRPGEKELPPVASAPRPPVPAPVASSAATRPEAPPPPPPAPLGRPSGSAQGSGAVTLNVSDFPFAWYLAAVQRKITERWEGRALQGRQPVVVFEIARDGQVSNVAIKDSSGNRYYDHTAMRAIADAAPFPRLPDEFPGSVLRIHLGFNFAQDRG